jgi:tryptophan 2,3-dioxygenase
MAPRAVLYRPLVDALGDKPNGLGGFATGGKFQQGFALWRFGHVQLVERIIGPMTGGTGGTLGAKYLTRTLQQRFFPQLWEVRARFFGAGGGRPAGT